MEIKYQSKEQWERVRKLNKKKLTLEQFKEAVKIDLLQNVNKKTAQELYSTYEKDIEEYYNKGWNVATMSASIFLGV